MIRSYLHQSITVVFLLSQILLVLVVGNPVMVQCQGANNHVAIELAHAKPCQDAGFMLQNSNATDALIAGQMSVSECVDTSLTQQPVLHQGNRFLLAALPVLFAFQVDQLPAMPVRVYQSPAHFLSPDSSESLAHNVILLI